MKLQKTKEIVREILSENTATRGDDNLLYLEVCKRCCGTIERMPFGYVMMRQGDIGIPPFETVRRSRQHLQEKFPLLKPSEAVQIGRAEKTAEWLEELGYN